MAVLDIVIFFIIKTTIFFYYAEDVKNPNIWHHHSSLELVNKEVLKSKYLFNQKCIFYLFYLPQCNMISFYRPGISILFEGNLVRISVEHVNIHIDREIWWA